MLCWSYRDTDNTKIIFITFSSVEIWDIVYRASFGKGYRFFKIVPQEYGDIERYFNSSAYWLRQLRHKTRTQLVLIRTKFALEVEYRRQGGGFQPAFIHSIESPIASETNIENVL